MTNTAILDEVWREDLFDRRSDAVFLLKFLLSKIRDGARNKSYVLNVDAGWGHGKTFFLKRFQKTIEHQGHLVAYVNAWADDHADDPLLPVLAAIDASISGAKGTKVKTKKSLGKLAIIGGQVAIAAGKGILQQAAHRYVGEEAIDVIKNAAGDVIGDIAKSGSEEAGKKLTNLYDAGGQVLLDKFRRGKHSIQEFKAQLTEVLAELDAKRRPLFVLVDELDRCRPTYAVALLERIKHMFEIDDVVFVLATDSDQLRHSIAGLYGAEFDAGRYLHRFFDQTYTFEKPRREPFIKSLINELDGRRLASPPGMSFSKYIGDVFDSLDLSLRDTEQCVNLLRNCVTAWPIPAASIELAVILPLIIAQQRRVMPTFDAAFATTLDMKLGGLSLRNVVVNIATYNRTEPRRQYDGWAVFLKFVNMAQSKTLFELANSEYSEPLERWILESFRNEVGARFPRGYNPAQDYKSYILDYPALVRSVGRLSPTR